jgi:hydroxymethylpyrimidine pyrophosphatase-like HAD family hydrolase
MSAMDALAGWLLVTDLDGTLWDGANRLHPGAREAVDELAAMGATVLAATGRRPASARLTLSEHGMLGPAVLFDGSLGVDLTSGEPFHVHPFPPGDARRVLELLDGCGVEPCANVLHPERDVLLGPSPSTHPLHRAYLEERARHVATREELAGETVLSYSITGREEALLRPALDAVRTVADASLSRDLLYGGMALSVRPPGVSKWSGVLAFCAARGLDPALTLAVGDGENDVELLAAAAVSCSFAGASPGAVAAAGHVLPPAGEGGWAALLALAREVAGAGVGDGAAAAE